MGKKFVAAVVQERNGTWTVLKVSDGGEDNAPKGTIVARLPSRHLGDALYQADVIEGKMPK